MKLSGKKIGTHMAARRGCTKCSGHGVGAGRQRKAVRGRGHTRGVAILAQGTHWALAQSRPFAEWDKGGGEERRHGFNPQAHHVRRRTVVGKRKERQRAFWAKRRVPMNAFWTRRNCGVEGGAYRLQAGFISIPSRPFGYDQV